MELAFFFEISGNSGSERIFFENPYSQKKVLNESAGIYRHM